ncbi:MAG: adenylate/guanylate cyclase domain-containing protein [Acidimicrobiia bacterium]|nr:adenylate/guanylate cyclase domain-containing protein [Acidimicrobiia bacterium]
MDAVTDTTVTSAGSVYDTRVERTFGFIDLSGFTRFTEEHGDAEAVKVLARFRAAVRDVSARRAVRVAKWLGDGAMLVSIEREPLVEAVVDIQHRISDCASPLPLRAGIAVGPVMMFEGDDYIGLAVNLAARLCDIAPPGKVIAPADIVSSLMVNTVAVPMGTASIKGLSAPVDLVAIDWA